MKPEDVPAGPLLVDTDVVSYWVLKADRAAAFTDLVAGRPLAISFATYGELLAAGRRARRRQRRRWRGGGCGTGVGGAGGEQGRGEGVYGVGGLCLLDGTDELVGGSRSTRSWECWKYATSRRWRGSRRHCSRRHSRARRCCSTACFRFMIEVMRDQRIHTQISALRSSDPALSYDDARQRVADAEQREPSAWRPFQLAFILMQLPALTDPAAPARSGDRARVELLFFPTGGGKTEAYLGLAAYTFAIRRRHALVSSSDGPLDGRDGVGVLMRYTLRLLTAQQFQRATTLVCAAELARRRDPDTWGSEPFRIGLWVGTDVSPKRWNEAEEQLRQDSGHRLTVLQVQRCPWCGSRIGARNVRAEKADRRVFVWCGDDLGRCPFAKGGEVADGLPVLTVDEEIYRMPPAFLIATVDKFARLAREGEAASLFGYVGRRCGRHGYVHADYGGCDITTIHRADGRLPAASVRPVGRLRPPDLIIQDELHLITGALGTTVGLFEVAVEELCSWQAADGTPVRPVIVASTATVRRAHDQVRGLDGRRVEIFPPQVLDAGDTYFAHELPVGPAGPPLRRGVRRGSGCPARRSGSPRCCCSPANFCSTGRATTLTRT